MGHRDLQLRLEHYVKGQLDLESRHAIEAHLTRCEPCRRWIDAYELVSKSLGTSVDHAHPDSDVLAWYVVRPDELSDDLHEAVFRHLDQCDVCQHDVTSLQSAVSESRPKFVMSEESTSRLELRAHRSRVLWALAATLAIAVGVTTIFRVGIRTPTPDSGLPHRDATLSSIDDPTRDGGDTPAAVADVEIHGSRLIEGERFITLNRVVIGDGADVTIRAKRAVALGNGVRVGSKARLQVTAGLGGRDRDSNRGASTPAGSG